MGIIHKMPHTPESRKRSPETREKLRLLRLAHNPFKGRKHSDETKAKMREAAARRTPRWKLPSWTGGRITDKNGYIQIYRPDHPCAVSGYILEHRLIMAETLGRPLTDAEEVHHKNEIRNDNRPENLDVMTKSEHSRLHRLKRPNLPQLRRLHHVPVTVQATFSVPVEAVPATTQP